jgi:hypothetical protein
VGRVSVVFSHLRRKGRAEDGAPEFVVGWQGRGILRLGSGQALGHPIIFGLSNMGHHIFGNYVHDSEQCNYPVVPGSEIGGGIRMFNFLPVSRAMRDSESARQPRNRLRGIKYVVRK